MMVKIDHTFALHFSIRLLFSLAFHALERTVQGSASCRAHSYGSSAGIPNVL